jgi:putative ABC transport system substrate-binding protein
MKTNTTGWSEHMPRESSRATSPVTFPSNDQTKIELIINLKTAKALGIALPLSLLGRADEVIE